MRITSIEQFKDVYEGYIFDSDGRPSLLECNIAGDEWHGLNLEAWVFSNVELAEVTITGCTFVGASFRKCTVMQGSIDDSNLDASEFIDTVVKRALIRKCSFSGAHWERTTVSDSTIGYSAFHGACILTSSIVQSKVYDTKFTKATIVGSLFTDSMLTDVSFILTLFNRVSFLEATLCCVDVSTADLTRVVGDGSTIYSMQIGWECVTFTRAGINIGDWRSSMFDIGSCVVGTDKEDWWNTWGDMAMEAIKKH